MILKQNISKITKYDVLIQKTIDNFNTLWYIIKEVNTMLLATFSQIILPVSIVLLMVIVGVYVLN